MDFQITKKVKYHFLSLDLVLGTTQRIISTDLHNNRAFFWLWCSFLKAVFSMIRTFPTAHTEVSDQVLESYLTVPVSCQSVHISGNSATKNTEKRKTLQRNLCEKQFCFKCVKSKWLFILIPLQIILVHV